MFGSNRFCLHFLSCNNFTTFITDYFLLSALAAFFLCGVYGTTSKRPERNSSTNSAAVLLLSTTMNCVPQIPLCLEQTDTNKNIRSSECCSDSCTGSNNESLGFTTLPRDEEDPRFILAFPTTSEEDLSAAATFFETYGFVV